MPYIIRKLPKKDLYKVYNKETKKVHSYATTLENAKKQVSLLYMKEREAKEGGALKPNVTDLKSVRDEEEKVIHPIFCRVGGKTSIVEDILKVIPKHTTYVEAFAGGASVFWNKPKAKQNVLNDLDAELIDGYKALKKASTNPADYPFIDDKNEKIRKDKMNEFISKNYTNPTSIVMKTIYKTCNTYASSGKGKIFLPRHQKTKLNLISYFIDKIKNNVVITSQDYKAVLKKYDKSTTFFFLDPPYEKSGELYKNSYIDYEEMADLLKKIKGKFLVTINDSPEIRKIFKDSGIETDNFKSDGIVSLPEFRSVKIDLPTYMFKRLPDINGKPPPYRYRLVVPITSSRNISSRKQETSLNISQKSVANPIVNIDEPNYQPRIEEFSPADRQKIQDYYYRLEQNENRNPDEIDKDAYVIKPRGKPLPCNDAKPKQPKPPKEKKPIGRPKKPKQEEKPTEDLFAKLVTKENISKVPSVKSSVKSSVPSKKSKLSLSNMSAIPNEFDEDDIEFINDDAKTEKSGKTSKSSKSSKSSGS